MGDGSESPGSVQERAGLVPRPRTRVDLAGNRALSAEPRNRGFATDYTVLVTRSTEQREVVDSLRKLTTKGTDECWS